MDKNKMRGKVGGQAVIEGVMMRGVDRAAMAVRLPDGTIDLEEWPLKKPNFFRKVPIIRGIINFIITLVEGYSCLTKSAEKSGFDDDDGEMTNFEKKLNDKFGDNLVSIVTIIGSILGVLLAVVLFMLVPSYIVKGIDWLVPLGAYKALIEGIIKIIIFITYLGLVSKLSDIRRVFEYHGAEHKTIFCFEAGEELTVENVRKFSRFHPRCGTSFIVIILVISILVFSLPFMPWENMLVRTAIKIALMPVILGIAYEFIKIAGRSDNWLTKAISFPGLKIQHLTTKEPDDSQIEIAIAALKPCVPQQVENE